MNRLRLLALTSTIAACAAFAQPASAATCFGSCGTSGADGDVTLSPSGKSTYDWVSTFEGQPGRGQISGEGGTNGSELLSDAFFAAAGSNVKFFFNYVTSDGSGYADYAFAQLVNVNTSQAINLFTARTKPSGSIVPGQDLPGVIADLNPSSVPITNGSGNENGASQGPVWAPLGESSGACFNAGCGLTGWVESNYTVAEAGTYQLRFGVTNWSDSAFDSGMAFDGLLLDGQVIGDGSSADNPLLPDNIVNGSFQFEFTATPNQVVFIDPLVAVGYTYEVGSGPNILSALFPELGDADGYDLYTLDDILIASGVAANTTYNFGPGGVTGFKLLDIETDPPLDPTNPTAFVTGLTFAVSVGQQTVNISQTPITLDVPGAVPEPATWAMMILGFGLAGAAIRRRRVLAIA